ncbi:phage portal protein [Anaerotignum lactatifermentans]|uniref:phage portal protein n=1 Tax=Anaerotignum lactatifermentans TaxID=160404 RepID=UPI00187433B3|nr:phage portal protein [Anaerotignum lactatifermentans]MBE5076528.1 phage portal protein [Anaerotignum lactatifermentans]
MGFLDIFKKNSKSANDAEMGETRMLTMEYLSDILAGNEMTEAKAMEIPAVAASVEYIGNKVALAPVYLYSKEKDGIRKVENDNRVHLLNEEPSNLFDSVLFRKMMVKDYLLHGVCYAYKKMVGNTITELVYVPPEQVQKTWSDNVLDRTVRYWIQGKEIPEYQLVRIMRQSDDGVNAEGILQTNKSELLLAYTQVLFGKKIMDRNGRKAGFLTVQDKLSKEAFEELKAKWPDVYSGQKEATMVLNAGVHFNEMSSSLQEMQVVENKKYDSEKINNLFGISPAILNGTATDEQEINTFETAVLPILAALEKGLNKYLLLEREKKDRYFHFDVDTALMGTMEKRFNVYKIGKEGGWMQIDEIRERENMKKLGLNHITLGLQDVLYDPDTKEIFIPNMAATMKTSGKGGVKIDES